MRRIHFGLLVAFCLVLGLACVFLIGQPGEAADHRESAGTSADTAADIADVDAWHEDGKLYAALTVAGLITQHLDTAPVYDTKVLYQFNIDNDGDSRADRIVDMRFGKNSLGKYGIRVSGLPGAAGTISGPVEKVLKSGTARVFAGVRDDPFFFDLAGFRTTLATGTLSFDSTRNAFAKFDTVALVLEMDLLEAQGDDANAVLRVWGESGRLSN